MSVAPTKSNLMNLKEELDIAEEGHSLLDEKREVLIMELMNNVRGYKDLEEEITKKLNQAYDSLENAMLSTGEGPFRKVAKNTRETQVEARTKSVMGIPVPEIMVDTPKLQGPVPLEETDEYFDEAYLNFLEIVEKLVEWAEKEALLWKLGNEVKKTQKRVNALENKFIPQYEGQIKKIEEALEEEEREEFFRRKKLKDKEDSDG